MIVAGSTSVCVECSTFTNPRKICFHTFLGEQKPTIRAVVSPLPNNNMCHSPSSIPITFQCFVQFLLKKSKITNSNISIHSRPSNVPGTV